MQFKYVSQKRTMILAGFAIIFLVSACGGTSTPSTGSKPPASSTNVPTVAKSKPTGVPAISDAFCNTILTKSEASQITGTQVNNERTITTAHGGSCNYEFAPYKAAVFVAFFPGSANTLDLQTSALTSNPNFKGTVTKIDGVGDAAIFIVNPLTSSITQYHLSVAYGALFLDFVIPNNTVGSSDAVALSQLKQVAALVLGRL